MRQPLPSRKGNIRNLFLLIGLLVLCGVPAKAEDRVYIPTNVGDAYPPPTPDGRDNALPATGSLREAIALANRFALPGDNVVINLLEGATYKIERSTAFTAEGQEWNSDTGADFDLDMWHGDLDIMQSMVINGNNATIDAQRLARIFHIWGSDDPEKKVNVVLRNLTLKGGGHSFLEGGGAIRVQGEVALVLENVRFEDHLISGSSSTSGPLRGGAIYIDNNTSSTVRLVNCHFENCQVVTNPVLTFEALGGAIYAASSTLVVEKTTFRQCHARQNAVSYGKEARGGVRLVECYFEENSTLTAPGSTVIFAVQGANSEGGAIYVANGVGLFQAEKTIFQKNAAKAGRGSHGGIWIPSGTLSMNYSGAQGGSGAGWGAVYCSREQHLFCI